MTTKFQLYTPSTNPERKKNRQSRICHSIKAHLPLQIKVFIFCGGKRAFTQRALLTALIIHLNLLSQIKPVKPPEFEGQRQNIPSVPMGGSAEDIIRQLNQQAAIQMGNPLPLIPPSDPQFESEVKKIDFPNFLESLNYRDITSEATAINCAFVSQILNDFTGEEELFPTVSGRMSSSSFNFGINSSTGLLNINVENSQVEIDGGYEGTNSLNLIEAKNYLSDDFLVRQLYYPNKLWANKIEKKVRPIFLTYTNGIFHLREYAFEDLNHYNSLKLIQQRKYAVQEGAINTETIQKISNEIVTINEPQIPFPQADSFERVINLCELLKQKGASTKEDITINYDFDSRQTDYYSNAGKYLGLINDKTENGQVICFLTEKGEQVFNLSIIERQSEFVKLILSHLVFKRVLDLYMNTGSIPSKEEIVEVMKTSNLYNVNSDTTFFRRASTINGWINWIMNLIEE